MTAFLVNAAGRPTRHEFVGTDVRPWAGSHSGESAEFRLYRCTETGVVRVWGCE